MVKKLQKFCTQFIHSFLKNTIKHLYTFLKNNDGLNNNEIKIMYNISIYDYSTEDRK